MDRRRDPLVPGCVVTYYHHRLRRVLEYAVAVVSPCGEFFMTTCYPPQVLRADQVEIAIRAPTNWRAAVQVLANAEGDPRQAWAMDYLAHHPVIGDNYYG